MNAFRWERQTNDCLKGLLLETNNLSSGTLCILSYLLHILESNNNVIKQRHIFLYSTNNLMS